jgi:geranylgeranyl pyrophosphate synthase
MDDDDLRRGRPTTHKAYGEATAILVGDALQGEAFRVLATAPDIDAELRVRLIEVLARAAGWQGMVGGQHLDIAGADDVREIHDRKTGALLAASVEAGAIVGGADATAVAAFRTFGSELGWLFQLVDDLLDEVGTDEELGKPSGSDRRHDKRTAVATHGGVDGLRTTVEEQRDVCLRLALGLPNDGGALGSIVEYIAARDR